METKALERTQEDKLLEIIQNRRTISHMKDIMPTRAQIERILEAGTYAPNHYKVEPWKFFVLTGKAREDLGNVMMEALAIRLQDTTNLKAQERLQKEQQRPLQAPVTIVVAVERPQLSWEREIENVEAVAAAVQNMLLMAEALGLASLWRTGNACYDEHVKAWFNLAPEDHLVAFLQLGYAATTRPKRYPTPFELKTQWLGNVQDWEQFR